jgi:hypothetical protein
MRKLITLQGKNMKKIWLIPTFWILILPGMPALASGGLNALIRDLLVESCGAQMKAAKIQQNLSSERSGTFITTEGKIRVSASGKTVDSPVHFTFIQKDSFSKGEYYLSLHHQVSSNMFYNEEDLRGAFGCKGRLRDRKGRLRDPFDPDFYERVVNFR